MAGGSERAGHPVPGAVVIRSLAQGPMVILVKSVTGLKPATFQSAAQSYTLPSILYFACCATRKIPEVELCWQKHRDMWFFSDNISFTVGNYVHLVRLQELVSVESVMM